MTIRSHHGPPPGSDAARERQRVEYAFSGTRARRGDPGVRDGRDARFAELDALIAADELEQRARARRLGRPWPPAEDDGGAA